MKILIITGIFPPDIGGPASYVPQMAESLNERGHDVQLLTLSDTGSHDDSDYSFGVTRILRGQFKPLRWVMTVFNQRNSSMLASGSKIIILYYQRSAVGVIPRDTFRSSII